MSAPAPPPVESAVSANGFCSREYLFPLDTPRPFCEIKGCGVWYTENVYATASTCYEAKDPSRKESLANHVLYAEGMNKIWHDIYPPEVHENTIAFWPFDEPLYPIPVGASVYYFALLAFLTTFYYTYLGRKVLWRFKNSLDLHPEANHFPNLPLYWIQQSKREADLRREVRNTWAWLARRYLLSPNDPLLSSVDQVLGLVNWHDFEVSRTTWSLLKIILTNNQMFVKVTKDRKEKTKDIEITKDLPDKDADEDDPVYSTRVFEGNPQPKPPKPPPPPREKKVIIQPPPPPPPKPEPEPEPEEEESSPEPTPVPSVPSSQRRRRRRKIKKVVSIQPGEWRFFYHPKSYSNRY